MSLRTIANSINRILFRPIHLTAVIRGTDNREKRLGHVKKSDKLEGEYEAIAATHSAYELIDENLMDRVINDMKFKDIPIVHIICTRNNTKISITKGDGHTLLLRSAGTEGYKNCRKGTTVAAQAVANRSLTYAKDHDINMVRLVFNGLGPGRGAAYKVFELSDLKIISLSDRTEAIEPWIKRPRKAKRL